MAEKKKVNYKPRTAAEKLEVFADTSAQESAELAEEGGVTAAAYVDYVPALENYESRTDIETLDRRRRRDIGRDFNAAQFRRNVADQEEGLMTTDTIKPAPSAVEDGGADSKVPNPKDPGAQPKSDGPGDKPSKPSK